LNNQWDNSYFLSFLYFSARVLFKCFPRKTITKS